MLPFDRSMGRFEIEKRNNMKSHFSQNSFTFLYNFTKITGQIILVMKRYIFLFFLIILCYFQGKGQQFEETTPLFDTSFYDYYKRNAWRFSYEEINKKEELTNKRYNTIEITIETFKEKENEIIKKLNTAPNIKNLLIDQDGFFFEKCKINDIKLRALQHIKFLKIDVADFENITPILEEIAKMPQIEYVEFYPWSTRSISLPRKLLKKLKGICIGQNYIIPNTPNNIENLAIRRQSTHEIEQTLSQIDKNKIKYLEIKVDTLTKKAVKELAKFPRLERLLLEAYETAPFVNNLKNLKNLKSLHIPTISNKDFINLKKLKSLETLSITLDSLQAEDCSVLWNLPKLRKIKVHTYDNKKLLWQTAKYRNIEILYLNGHWELTKIDDDLSNFRRLKEIYIGKHQLKALPKNFTNLQELEVLNISHNQITQLPKEIGKLKKLKKLLASRNKIIEIPHSIKGCKELEKIDLSNNSIQKLPVELFELSKLKKLRLNGNKLTKILKELGNLKTLKELWLGSIFKEENSNNIDALPIEIQQLTNLKTLDLSKNRNLGNTILPVLLKMPNKWDCIYLCACGISKLPESGWKNSLLPSIDLSCNDIFKVPQEIFFSKINYLNLRNTPLKDLNAIINGNKELKVYAYLNGVISKEELLKEPDIAKAAFKIINKCYIGDRVNPILKLYPILEATDSTLARKASEKDIYAISLCKAKRYKESIPYFNKSIEIDLSDNITWFNSTLRLFYYRHLAFLNTGDTISAIKDLKYITTKLDEDFSSRIFEYAYLTNDTKTSKEYLPKALEYYKNKAKPINQLSYLELLLITGKMAEFDSYNKQLVFPKSENKNYYFIHKYLEVLRNHTSQNFVKNATKLIQEMQLANYKGTGWGCQLVVKWAENKKDKQIIQKLNSFICP